MSDFETEDPVEDGGDTLLRTEVQDRAGRTYKVREKFSTVVRYRNKALKENDMVVLSTSPRNRVAFDPNGLIAVELER